MHRILFLPDIRLIQRPDTGTGYPVRAGYRISGLISGRILGLTTIFLVKYQIKVLIEIHISNIKSYLKPPRGSLSAGLAAAAGELPNEKAAAGAAAEVGLGLAAVVAADALLLPPPNVKLGAADAPAAAAVGPPVAALLAPNVNGAAAVMLSDLTADVLPNPPPPPAGEPKAGLVACPPNTKAAGAVDSAVAGLAAAARPKEKPPVEGGDAAVATLPNVNATNRKCIFNRSGENPFF
jgi:hypothetical protein